jgi:hypothetical protein
MKGVGIKENDGGGNLAKIHCKHFSQYHNVPQYNNNMIMIKKSNHSGICLYVCMYVCMHGNSTGKPVNSHN